MKAVRYHGHGNSQVLRDEEVERPTPGAGQVLVRVAATSFNPVDDHIRAGVLAEMIPISLPFVPGIDVAGTVAELGDGVAGLEVGDTVVAMLPLDAAGASAEYVLAPAQALAAAPRTMDLIDAAALPIAGLAAWQSLFELAKLRPGQTVLINGAGGAVGSIAVQLAVEAGATVTAADDPQHADRLLGYGAQGRRPPGSRRRSGRRRRAVPGRAEPCARLPGRRGCAVRVRRRPPPARPSCARSTRTPEPGAWPARPSCWHPDRTATGHERDVPGAE